MSTVRLRPTFSIASQRSPEELMCAVRNVVEQNSMELSGQFRQFHAVVTVVDQRKHFWSPWLNLEIRNSPTERILFGRFSPHPSIWTGFMFSYLALGVIAFFAVMFGVSQQLAEMEPWGPDPIVFGTGIALGLYLSRRTGFRQ